MSDAHVCFPLQVMLLLVLALYVFGIVACTLFRSNEDMQVLDPIRSLMPCDKPENEIHLPCLAE